MSVASASNPFRNVSYDVLREIFFHCLPEHPLDQVQPNTTIAPILLCHVCSSWRAVALSSPYLWSHLHIKLPISWEVDSIQGPAYEVPIVRDLEALARNIEFMKWWRTNHGSVAPFLCFNLQRRSRDESLPNYGGFRYDAQIFLFDYLSSAQYLEIGIFYKYMLQEIAKRGLPIATFSKLRTLVCRQNRHTDDYDPEDEILYDVELQPSHIPPTLRRLSIHEETMTKDYLSSLNNQWSTLTHLSLNPVYLSFDIWFSLIRKLVNLQWADFSLSLVGNPQDAIDFPQYTHSSLSTLTMSCYHSTAEFPLSALFQNLRLPALHTLYLSSGVVSWGDYRATIEIHNVLKSAPAITKLILGLGFRGREEDSGTPGAINGNNHLLSMDAPHLVHLQIALRYMREMDTGELARNFVKNFFVSRDWLDLASATNTIRKITIAVENTRAEAIPGFDGIMRDLLLWNIQKYVTTAANILFEVVSMADVGMDSVSMSAWKVWGSKI